MTEAQPPAGWYPDPQDATQQRYWDGGAWTAHTASAAVTSTPPQGDITGAPPVVAADAPAWSVPMAPDGTQTTAKKAWYKRKRFIIPIAVLVVLVVLGVLGVVFGSGSDHSNALENAIKDDGQAQLQSGWSQQLPGSKVDVTDVTCVEKGDTQEYTCLLHLSVTYQGETKQFIQDATGSCDNNVRAKCLWHTTDAAQLTAQQ